ncbi:hypothetical protein HHI36_020862 [Cryptolaemus montrouzieri]|uniref:Uncharacterized protein n=1 Tax=Cryptolaemus montrouzieri TaxID=559131 RepID=A0ABD2NC06_9CUCU
MEEHLEIDAIGFSPNPKVAVPSGVHEGPSPYATCYNMNHAKRGLAVIFNHKHFSIAQCPTRRGTNKDRDDLKKLFGKFNFEVQCYNDLTKDEVRKVLIQVAVNDHTNEDCLVIVILSHGDNRKIFAKDTYYPTDLLWNYFDGNHAPTLAGKPKLFFIQACRGEEVDKGVRMMGRTEVDSNTKHEHSFYSIPVMADILVMYSTAEFYLSWRNPESGSYFIQSLIRQLSAHADKKDLLSILTYVNREVAIGNSPEMLRDKLIGYANKQICCIVSMLTREIYLM